MLKLMYYFGAGLCRSSRTAPPFFLSGHGGLLLGAEDENW